MLYENELVSRIINNEDLLLVDNINNIPDLFVKRELVALALNVYHEARGSTKEDMIAVAVVTMNRLGHRQFRNTIEEVVFQPYQFSWTRLHKDLLPKEKIWKDCQEIAYKVYANLNLPKSLTANLINVYHYSRYDIIGKVSWHNKMLNRVRIGAHVYMS